MMINEMNHEKLSILISNDDGVNAMGINVLYQNLKKNFSCTVCAPSDEKSTTGHSLNLDHPVRLHQMPGDPHVYHCTGFPADSVLMGLGQVMKNHRPDVVVSGTNRGANLGQDLYYSGTMAAAREAAFHKIPSIAISLVIKKSTDAQYFETAAEVVSHLLKNQIHRLIPELGMININVPNIPLNQIKGLKIARMGLRKYSEQIDKRSDSRERSYYWIAGHLEGHLDMNGESDCEIVEDNFVAITPLNLIQGIDGDFHQLKLLIKNLEKFPHV
ncbi:MAG: 5'/3'-nucleotidase SurE [Bacteriovoracaceae bacterium]|nr:5'/3'-nucleotidase SurE [Bacteriovoracaceae bacterium]